jgi:iron uptake system EfeUOB component EfeO/EfeM
VSLIIKECRQDDPDFDLLREVAFIIKNKSMDLNFLASSIRLRRILEDNGLNEEQMESFIEKIEVHCLKRSLKADEFINLISNKSDISNNLNMAIDSLPEYVSQQKRVLYEIVDKVVDLKIEKEDLLEEKNLTMDILMDYEKNRPVAEKLVVTRL